MAWRDAWALFTSPSNPPKVVPASSTAVAATALSLTSPNTNRMVAPRSCWRDSAASPLTSTATTLAPRATITVEIAPPIPEAPPVTITTLFSS